MTATEYQQLANRTCPDLGSITKNILHMDRGIITECGELIDLMKGLDAYNKVFTKGQIVEELGDLSWYIANKCTFENEQFTFDNFPTIELDLRENPIDIVVGQMFQELILNDPMTNSRLTCLWYTLVEFLGYEVSEVLETNINKLKQRYPKGFNTHDAINRNLDAEKIILNA